MNTFLIDFVTDSLTRAIFLEAVEDEDFIDCILVGIKEVSRHLKLSFLNSSSKNKRAKRLCMYEQFSFNII